MNPHLKKLAMLVPALFFIALIFGMPSIASAADRYWVGSTGTWDTSDTSHWSASSGGASGASVPTSSDNCVFDANSFGGVGTVTISGTVECLAMTWNSIASPPVLTIPAGQQLNTYGSLDFSASVAGMTVNGPGFILLRAPSSAGIQTITAGNLVNIATGMLVFDGGSYQLSSNLIANTLYLSTGTFDANDFDVTLSNFSSNNANSRTLYMGYGTWTLNAVGSQWDVSFSNMSLNPEGSTLTFSATDASQKDFYGGNLAYQNVHFNGRNIVIHDSNSYNDTFAVNNAGLADALFVENGTTQTVVNFTTNGSAGNLAVIQALTPGTPFTLSKSSGLVVVDYMSIADSDATGGAAWYAGTHSTDGGGNSGWIFALPTDRYWIGGTGNWDGTDTTHWAYFSGGPGGASAPGSANNVFFDSNSFSGAGENVLLTTTDQNCLDMIWTSTDAPTFDFDAGSGHHLNIYGSLTFASGMTLVGFSGDAILMYGAAGPYGIQTNGVSVDLPFYIQGGGSYVLEDNFSGEDLNLFMGELNANVFDVAVDAFASSNTNTRSLTMGSGTWTLTGTGGVWNVATITNLSLDSGSSTIEITDTSGTLKQFSGGNLTYRNLTISGDAVEITDGNAFFTLNVNNAGLPVGLFINNATLVFVTNFTTNGSSGNVARLQASTPGTPFTLHRPSGGTVSVDYMNISDSSATGATWYAGANSTDGGGNSGWIFGTPPAPVAAPIAGTYTGTQSVTLTSPDSSSIRYTTNGTTPDCSTGLLYSGAFGVASSATVKAVGCFGVGSSPSLVGSFAYVIMSSHHSGGGGFYIPPPGTTPTPTPIPTPLPPSHVFSHGDPANLPRYGLHEGDVMGARPSGDPDVFIVNQWGYKRLFLNPVIFGFYGHLGGFAAVTSVVPFGRDAFPTSGLFRNCDTQDGKVYALEVTGEDTGTLHWINMTGDQAVFQDPEFFKKDFCINTREFNWYILSPVPYTSLTQLPIYHR